MAVLSNLRYSKLNSIEYLKVQSCQAYIIQVQMSGMR